MSEKQSHTHCSYCKELVRTDAIKCRYCGSALSTGPTLPASDPSGSLSFIKNALRGRYEIIKLIGKGGMASVYKARQLNLDRIIALKVIHPNLMYDKEFVNRFLQEARVCAKLRHPNIINVLDFGQEEGIYYMGMELLEGMDLAVMIKKKKRLRFDETIGYVAPVAHALRYIHQTGFMHRDVKSSNIFITHDGRPVLMDFGIAFAESNQPLTVAGTLLGTPQFISPEQALGNKAVPESDFYSLGIVMYECLTGRVPFNDPNPMLVINKIINENAPSPISIYKDIPRNGSDITMGLLQKEPSRRVSVVNQLLEDYLDFAMQQQPYVYHTPVYTSGRHSLEKKHRMTATSTGNREATLRIVLKSILALIVSILFGGAGYFLYNESGWFKSYDNLSSTNNGEQLIFREDELTGDDSVIADIYPNDVNISVIPEEGLVAMGNIQIMHHPVTEQLWGQVMDDNDAGSNTPATNLSFSQVSEFVEKLNAMPGNSYYYRLPLLEEITNAYDSGVIEERRNEWVGDPPVFRTGTRSNFAKYYNRRFHDEAGENRNRRRSDIYFRLVRSH
ncbi:MAG: serine/threonine-protein kinase [bacterium]